MFEVQRFVLVDGAMEGPGAGLGVGGGVWLGGTESAAKAVLMLKTIVFSCWFGIGGVAKR